MGPRNVGTSIGSTGTGSIGTGAGSVGTGAPVVGTGATSVGVGGAATRANEGAAACTCGKAALLPAVPSVGDGARLREGLASAMRFGDHGGPRHRPRDLCLLHRRFFGRFILHPLPLGDVLCELLLERTLEGLLGGRMLGRRRRARRCEPRAALRKRERLAN